MWESPIYKFNQEAGTDADGNLVYKQVVIDVTRSAPSFDTPKEVLAAALDEAVRVTGVGPEDIILDFGAGKLRNTIYLLEKGYRVCAVEFAQLFEQRQRPAGRKDIAREHLERAENEFADRFSKLVYPHDFEPAKRHFKLILLVNVMNTMPVPGERDFVLTLCNERLVDDGRLFWYTQRGDKHYKDRLNDRFQLGDGVYVGRTTYHKTFYREYEVKEIDDLLRLAGFDYDRRIEARWYNQCRLYMKTGPAVLAPVLDSESIDRARVTDDKIPDPKAVTAKSRAPKDEGRERFEPKRVASSGQKRKGNPVAAALTHKAKLVEALADLPQDLAQASSYEEIIKTIVEYIFAGRLRNFRFEQSAVLPAYRDVVADNPGEDGFFAALKREYKLNCPQILFECRNAQHTLKDPAFKQLGDGLSRMGFAFFAHRGGVRPALINRCQRVFRASGKIIVPLDDGDLRALLDIRESPNGALSIDQFLTERLREVMSPGKVFVSYSHRDKKYLEELQVQLQPLVRSGVVASWDDTKITAGADWNQLIRDAVATTQVAVLLISPDFIASDYIVNNELEPLLNPPSDRKLTIVPVAVRPTSPKDLPPKLETSQFVNFDYPLFGKRQDKKDEIWIKVKEAIRQGLA